MAGYMMCRPVLWVWPKTQQPERAWMFVIMKPLAFFVARSFPSTKTAAAVLMRSAPADKMRGWVVYSTVTTRRLMGLRNCFGCACGFTFNAGSGDYAKGYKPSYK